VKFYHTKCGGEIDLKARRCTECGKKWNPITFRLDPVGIRLALGRSTAIKDNFDRAYSRNRVEPAQRNYASWLDRVPKVVDLGLTRTLVNKLPRWPRWARVLTTVLVLAIVVVAYLIGR